MWTSLCVILVCLKLYENNEAGQNLLLSMKDFNFWEEVAKPSSRGLNESVDKGKLVVDNSESRVDESEVSYDLAKSQSFGYFDDISDSQWMRAKEIHARIFPNHNSDLKRFSNPVGADKRSQKMSNHWYSQNFFEEFRCPSAQRLPANGNPDGPKWVCDPHRLRNKPDCLVYSVGSAGKVEFERGVKEGIGPHCEIHTFDFTSYNRRNGHFEEGLKGLATFHHWGLGTENDARKNPSRFKTLNQTIQELGHENRTIDLFKIDCEGCEWSTFEQWIKQDIRQILVETHHAPFPTAKDFFYGLHDAGYVIFNKEANLIMQGTLVEYGFLKLSTDFFLNGTTYGQ